VPDRLAIGEVSIAGAWNVQGDGAADILGVPLPLAPNTVSRGADAAIFWVGPRSWLVLASAPPAVVGGVRFDVSASRVAFTIAGPQAETLLAKHCPLDFHDSRFAAGSCAQSLFGQVNALYYRHAARPAFTLLVARSFGRDVLHHLHASAAQYGYESAPLRPFVAD
jgi:sarcosine oxidase, subunit gamma